MFLNYRKKTANLFLHFYGYDLQQLHCGLSQLILIVKEKEIRPLRTHITVTEYGEIYHNPKTTIYYLSCTLIYSQENNVCSYSKNFELFILVDLNLLLNIVAS